MKKTVYNKLNTKVNSLNKKFLMHHLLQFRKINIIQIKKKIGDVDKNGLVTATVLNTKIEEVEKEIPDDSSLLTTTVLNKKIGEIQNKIPLKYQALKENNLLLVLIINLRVKSLMRN